MKKLYAGLAFLLFSFLIIALFVHNLNYWVSVKWWSLNMISLGSLLIVFGLSDRYKTSQLYQALFVPKKWYVGILSTLAFVLVLTFLYRLIDRTAHAANKKMQAYYLQKKIQGTTATVIGIVNIRFTLKSTYYQPFMAVEYVTPEGILRQGLDPKEFRHLQNGQKIDIIYSKDHPSIFKVM